MTPSGTALHAPLTGVIHSTTEKHAPQREMPCATASPVVPPTATVQVQLLHARLCQSIAAEYRGRAHGQFENSRPVAGKVDSDTAELWLALGGRLQNAFRGARQIVRSADVEMARRYARSLGPHTYGAGWKVRSVNVAELAELLECAVSGHVENICGVRHA